MVEYDYDFENRLISVDDNAAGTFAYTYEYRTRRIVRDETAATIPGELTTVVFSGGTSVREIEDTVTAVEYLRGSDWGGGVGGILYSLRSGAPSFSHANSRGDIVAKTNATGALTYQASYDAFGRHGDTASSAAIGTDPDRQKANSKDEDPTRLLNEGQRYRDLDTDTFITRDPLGFVDGPNMYAYVGQNPWTKFDPEGLFWKEFGEELYKSSFGIGGVGDRIGQGLVQTALVTADSVDYLAATAGGNTDNTGTRSELFRNIAVNPQGYDEAALRDDMIVSGGRGVTALLTAGGSELVASGYQTSQGNWKGAQDSAAMAFMAGTAVRTSSGESFKLTRSGPAVTPATGAPEESAALTAEQEALYSRVSIRPAIKQAVQEMNTDEAGNMYDQGNGTLIKPGEQWYMGHKEGFEFRKMQLDAAQRGLTREQWIEEQNNPNIYQPELPSTSSRGAHEAPENVSLPSNAAGTAHENSY